MNAQQQQARQIPPYAILKAVGHRACTKEQVLQRFSDALRPAAESALRQAVADGQLKLHRSRSPDNKVKATYTLTDAAVVPVSLTDVQEHALGVVRMMWEEKKPTIMPKLDAKPLLKKGLVAVAADLGFEVRVTPTDLGLTCRPASKLSDKELSRRKFFNFLVLPR